MGGLTQGLETARRALLAHQASMNVTGNNLANVNTEGYTRQRARLVPSSSAITSHGILGTGVVMEGVDRLRDVFLDAQIRQEIGMAGRWGARTSVLSRIEGVVNEPSDTGVAALLDSFWNSWLDLSNNPEDAAARSVVLQRGAALAQGLQQQDVRLRNVIESTDVDLEQRVSHLNARLEELANLNAQIRRAEIGGGVEANLRDRRDLIVDQLARECGATTMVRMDGSVVVRLGGRTVVQGNSTLRLSTQRYNEGGHVRVKVIFVDDKTSPAFMSGELSGLLEIRDEVLPNMLDRMDVMAKALIDTVNRLHEAGPSHLPFFRGHSAGTIQLAPEVAKDPSQVNAGTTGDPGDNDIAVAIGGLREARLLERGTATISDYYRGVVADLGSMGQQAAFLSESQESAVRSLEAQRQSVMGVNMDEELTRMITIQTAYEAAARVFSTMGKMFETLLNM